MAKVRGWLRRGKPPPSPQRVADQRSKTTRAIEQHNEVVEEARKAMRTVEDRK